MAQNNDSDKLKTELLALGLGKSGAARMYRLLTGKPTKKERARWIEVRVLSEKGDLLVDEGGDESSGIQICLFHAAYEGMLTRTQGGWINADQ